MVLICGPARVVVANTHLEWHPEDAEEDAKHGLFQAEELLGGMDGQDARIICGDFNAAPDSATLERFRRAGFIDPHPPSLATYNAAGKPVKLDYTLHSSDLIATPSPTTLVVPATALPSPVEPSDHVPLIASFSPKAR
jgi:endonuclease/exonuclease/phosphatase family metal-dependent hydrolase